MIDEMAHCRVYKTAEEREQVEQFWIWAYQHQDEFWAYVRKQNAQRHHHLATMPYRDYLQTPEWREKRKGALAAAGYRCQVCNFAGDLDVHHRTYERRGFEDPADLTALCRNCHELFHLRGKS
jgi:5-methylcytosine-specific restriction endonuclease McrA